MATKKATTTDRRRTKLAVAVDKLGYNGTSGSRSYIWTDTYPKVIDSIKSDIEFADYVRQEMGETTVVEKVIEKVVEPDLADTTKLAPEESAVIGETLMILEHRLHDATKRDYAENNGANWRENHEKAQTFLNLRKKMKLPDHKFAPECCVPVVEEADLQALATTAHGINAN